MSSPDGASWWLSLGGSLAGKGGGGGGALRVLPLLHDRVDVQLCNIFRSSLILVTCDSKLQIHICEHGGGVERGAFRDKLIKVKGCLMKCSEDGFFYGENRILNIK